MKLQVVDNGKGLHISPETEEEQKAIAFLVERRSDHEIHFDIHGKPLGQSSGFRDAMSRGHGFISITVGQPHPKAARDQFSSRLSASRGREP